MSDPLAATATAAPSAGAVTGAAPRTIGRYVITGELGRGGMGVVYAALDPDLDRRVALKVLHDIGSDAARARLLREARAMAKLQHPGVVVVYEVGSVDGVDYIAMELIDGSSLAEWLATGPSRRDILAAFEAAGRGLAAAHAAGLVHRDFKPHNVLRARGGRVVVTDFGLARASLPGDDDLTAAALTTTLPASASGTARDAGSLSSTLTATGAVLGTPAYMAPEQHAGAAVGPAADQFAFCVALWEALTRTRPFGGATLAAIREAIDAGPDRTSEAELPRALRAPLRRGLAAKPVDRFATVDDLLAAIGRRRFARVAVALGAALVIAAVAVAVVQLSGTAATEPTRASVPAIPGCAGSDDVVVPAALHQRLAASPAGIRIDKVVDHLAAEWQDAHAAACAGGGSADPAPRLQCLAGARADLTRLVRALAQLDVDELDDCDPGPMVHDPAACLSAHPPHRVVQDSDTAVAFSAAQCGRNTRRAALVEPPVDQPCLRAEYYLSRLRDFATMSRADRTADIEAGTIAADRCGDDVAFAAATVAGLMTDLGAILQDSTVSARIRAAADRAGDDPVFAITADLVDGGQAEFRNDLDTAIARFSAGATAALKRGAFGMTVILAVKEAEARSARAGAWDRDAAIAILNRALAVAPRSMRRQVQHSLFDALFADGQQEHALAVAAEMEDAADAPGSPGSDAVAVGGRVVDAVGSAVAGARVIADTDITVYDGAFDPVEPRRLVATSGSDGSFAIAAAPRGAWVMAAQGQRIGVPVPAGPHVVIQLRPTGEIAGKVNEQGPVGRVTVTAALDTAADHVVFLAPVAADGSWRMHGVPLGHAAVTIGYARDKYLQRAAVSAIPAAPPLLVDAIVRGLRLDVVVRSEVDAPLGFALVFVVRGAVAAKTVRALGSAKADFRKALALPTRLHDAPDEVRAKLGDRLRDGDAITRFDAVEPRDVSVCAIGTTGDLLDPAFQQRFTAHAPDAPLTCVVVHLHGDGEVVEIAVPPMKRFD